jgi:glutaredoxin
VKKINNATQGDSMLSPRPKTIVLILVVAAVLAFLVFPSADGFAQIYKWRDKDGSIRFSDTPPPAGTQAETLKLGEAPKAQEGVPKRPSDKRAYSEIQVIMYMTDWCPYCRKAREYLNSLGVNLTEYNVDRDKAREEERLRKAGGGTGVPVIDVEGIIIRGFNSDRIKEAVEKKRSL